MGTGELTQMGNVVCASFVVWDCIWFGVTSTVEKNGGVLAVENIH